MREDAHRDQDDHDHHREIAQMGMPVVGLPHPDPAKLFAPRFIQFHDLPLLALVPLLF